MYQGSGKFQSPAAQQHLLETKSTTGSTDDVENAGHALTEDNWITDDDLGSSDSEEDDAELEAIQNWATDNEDSGSKLQSPSEDEPGSTHKDDNGVGDENGSRRSGGASQKSVASSRTPPRPLTKKQRAKMEREERARERRTVARQALVAVLALIAVTIIISFMVLILAGSKSGSNANNNNNNNNEAGNTNNDNIGQTAVPTAMTTGIDGSITTAVPMSGPSNRTLPPTVGPKPTIAPTTKEGGLRPPNDFCGDALPIILRTPDIINGTTMGSSSKANLPVCDDGDIRANGYGVWYQVQGRGQFLRADTCDESTTFDTQISVYLDPWDASIHDDAENWCAELQCVVGNDQQCPGGGSSVQWFGVRDQIYYILVHGYRSNVGQFVLTVNQDENDACVWAINISQPQFKYENYGIPLTHTYRIDGQIRKAVTTTIPNCSSTTPATTHANTSSISANSTNTILGILLENEGTAWYSIIGTGRILVPQVIWKDDVRSRYLQNGIPVDTGAQDPHEDWVMVEADNPYKASYEAATNWVYVPEDAERPPPYGGSNVFGPNPTPINPYVSVFGGSSCDDLTCVALDGPGWQSEGGVEYQLLINGGSERVGQFFRLTVIEFRESVAGVPLATNSECFGARFVDNENSPYRIPANGTKLHGSTVNAGRSLVPSCGNEVFSTSDGVWYTVMGTGEGMTISTCNDDNATAMDLLDTQISVFKGSCKELICVDGNDEACGDQSSVSFFSEPDELYYVLVHGFGDRVGEFSIGTKPAVVSSNHTTCSSPMEIEPDGRSVLGRILGNTKATVLCGDDRTASSIGVWYKIVGDGGQMTASTCSSSVTVEPHLVLYHGPEYSCSDLSCLQVTNSGCTITWQTETSEPYFLFVYREGNGEGSGADSNFVLTLDTVVANDVCENAVAIPTQDGSASTTFGSTRSTALSEKFLACDDGNVTSTVPDIYPERGVWYQMVGTGSNMSASTCSIHTNFNASLSIWSGTCNDFQCIPVKSTPCETQTNGERLEWASFAGEIFSVLVHGEDKEESGNFALSIRSITEYAS